MAVTQHSKMDSSFSLQLSYLQLLLDETNSDKQWDCAITSSEFHKYADAVESELNCAHLWDNELMDLQLVCAIENMEKRAVYQPITEDISDEEAATFDLGFDMEKHAEP